MPNLIEVNYGQTGQSTNTDALGMREMQARVYAQRDAQYLLVKAPPASGKSRALMFLALDKMHRQGVTKTIVAVPERSIAASFAPTRLSAYGFPYDWALNPRYDLCSGGGEASKRQQFKDFLGIGYHFYQGKYTSAIPEILDTDKKTILHIPSPNAGESTKDKHGEVDAILDSIGTVIYTDPETRIMTVERHADGKQLKVADLVWDALNDRDRVVSYLRKIREPEEMDLIIALGMAKEGFDWPFCEHALTVGYRGSLTEVIQIIGRCTRDSPNKTHAQFTNLIAQPDAEDDEVTFAVNNMLKAITCSLLMEQVLAPNFKFKTRVSDDETNAPGELKIRGLKEPSSKRVQDIIESDLNDLKATILQDKSMQKAMPGGVDPEVINQILIPKIIQTKYPDLDEREAEALRQHVVVDSVMAGAMMEEGGDRRIIKMGNKFINIDELSIDLIDSINPFQKAFEILSKQVTAPVLKAIMGCIETNRLQMTEQEALLLWPKIKAYVKEHGHEPPLNAYDGEVKRMAEAIQFLKHQRRQKGL